MFFLFPFVIVLTPTYIEIATFPSALALRKEEHGAEELGGDLHAATGNERRK